MIRSKTGKLQLKNDTNELKWDLTDDDDDLKKQENKIKITI